MGASEASDADEDGVATSAVRVPSARLDRRLAWLGEERVGAGGDHWRLTRTLTGSEAQHSSEQALAHMETCMAEKEIDYCRHRARVELEIAHQCDKHEVATVHYALAELYLARVKELRAAAGQAVDGPPK